MIDKTLQPRGYRILLEPIQIEEVTEGGIVLPSQVQDNEKLLAQIGRVVAMGEQCYDHEKFNGHIYCDVGDYVLHGQYVGCVIEGRDGTRYRLINDDEVLATVSDPNVLKRAR